MCSGHGLSVRLIRFICIFQFFKQLPMFRLNNYDYECWWMCVEEHILSFSVITHNSSVVLVYFDCMNYYQDWFQVMAQDFSKKDSHSWACSSCLAKTCEVFWWINGSYWSKIKNKKCIYAYIWKKEKASW